MNDSFSGKNGKVKVMYVRSDDDSSDDRNKNKRPAGKGRPADGARSGRTGQDKPRGNNDRRGSDSRRSESDCPRRPAPTEDRGGYDSPWKTVSRAPEEEPAFDHGGISGKALSIRSSCAANVRKKPASTVRMPVRLCSPAARTPLFAPGSCSPLRRVSAKRCAGWRLTAKLTTWWMKKSWRKRPAPNTTAACVS